MSKNKAPRRKTLTRIERLASAKGWITKYNGLNLISGYAKWFGVDKICAINELKALGVIIPEKVEIQVVESHHRKIEQRSKAKDKALTSDQSVIDSDEYFAYIAGYTSGGFPFGLTHEELKQAVHDKNDRLDNFSDRSTS